MREPAKDPEIAGEGARTEACAGRGGRVVEAHAGGEEVETAFFPPGRPGEQVSREALGRIEFGYG